VYKKIKGQGVRATRVILCALHLRNAYLVKEKLMEKARGAHVRAHVKKM